IPTPSSAMAKSNEPGSDRSDVFILPLIMFTVRKYDLPYGMAVTASHNPALYNGIKVFTQGGRDATELVTDEIESYILKLESSDINIVPYEDAVGEQLVKIINPFNSYIDNILSLIALDTIKDKNLKIALDPMYGVSRTSLQTILLTARCEVDVIHDRHDTLFGGRLPSPKLETLSALSTYVVERKCDMGIATDGDADRIGIIDDTGKFLHPNKLLVLLYYYLLKYRGWKGAAVRNNSTTHLLDRVAKGYGEECHEVPVGFKHISAKMQESDALIGGESSGGLTVRGHILGKDGIYAAALLVEMEAKTGKKLSQIYEEITDRFGESYTMDSDIRMTPADKEKLRKLLFEQKALPNFPFDIDRISYQDGCKIYFKNGGWVICRFSGTEPLLRIYSEMPDIENAKVCIDIWQNFLES
ncbi:MAG: phosphoglucomutase/phosphomannomutase family protein, partial [Clostridia bacterium]|nr:phosphoglucomutase/phosphomannomutase family protein [Clostridia bacterium]